MEDVQQALDAGLLGVIITLGYWAKQLATRWLDILEKEPTWSKLRFADEDDGDGDEGDEAA